MDPQTSHQPDRFPTLTGDDAAGSGFPGVPEVYTAAPLTPAPEPRQAHRVDPEPAYESPQIEVDVEVEVTERFEPVPELAADPAASGGYAGDADHAGAGGSGGAGDDAGAGGHGGDASPGP